MGFLARSAAHSAAKDAANQEWIRLLKEAKTLTVGPHAYLDAFTKASGFQLRTTEALLAEGVSPLLLFSANLDKGIVDHLAKVGVNAVNSKWEDALPSWPKLRGIFLDLCSGSAAVIICHLTALWDHCHKNCVLGFTIVQRDFDGEFLVMRVLWIVDLLLVQGWKPARGPLYSSTLPYRNSCGFQVVLQFWTLGQD